MNKNKDAMKPKGWDRIKKLKLTNRYYHISAKAGMVPNPVDPMLPPVPYVERPGITLVTTRATLRRGETNIPRTNA